MTPKRIILVRHGESEANVDPSVYARVPDWRIQLTEKGIAQAKEAGERICSLLGDETFGVFVSPYQRTMQTKDGILDGIGRSPVFDHQDPELREQEYGNMPPSDINQANREFRGKFGYFFYRFPEGESCADVYDRMALFMDSLFRRFDRPNCPENIVIVSHGTAIKCFLTRWYHWDVVNFDKLPQLPNCHISVMTRCESEQGTASSKFALSEPFENQKCLSQNKED